MDPAQIQNPKSKIQTFHWILLALTIFAAIIRFSFLSRPALWYDEVATYTRVSGTFQEFLDVHQRDAFTPLHYELYWVIGRIFKLTPMMMRFAPALAGTLMVPAIYWLGRQICSRRTSLVAAALAASSAYLINFSRDAKMYMEFWFFCTLCMASFLWWLRTGLRIAWLAWVASGAAMVGLHLTGLIVIGLQPMFLLTRGRMFALPTFESLHWWVGRRVLSELRVIAMFLIGAIVIGAGAAGHFLQFSKWSDRAGRNDQQLSEYVEGLRIPGIDWIPQINEGRRGPDLLMQASTAFLYAFEWPRAIDLDRIDPRVMQVMTIAAWLMFTLLLAAALPWPRKWMTPDDGSAREPWWRGMLWITFWIVVPVYAFYCASMEGFTPPRLWFEYLRTIRGGIYLTIGLTLIASGVLIAYWYRFGAEMTWITIRRRAIRLIQLALVVAGIYLLCVVVYQNFLTREPRSVWVPRYLGFIWPAMVVGCAALLMRLPTKPLRCCAIGIFVAINLTQAITKIALYVEPPIDKVAADVWAAQDSNSLVRTYSNLSYGPPIPGGGSIYSLVGKYYLAMESGWRVNPRDLFGRPGGDDEVSRIKVGRAMTDASVANDLNNSPRLKRLIVWDQFEGIRGIPADTLTARMPTGWKLMAVQEFTTWEHWTWKYMSTLRRREYVKEAAK